MGRQVIRELYAFIADDQLGEGVTSFQSGDIHWPMVAADKDRVDSLRKMAQIIANQFGKEIKLVRFTAREELETITPKETNEKG